jgi:superfamily II DNA or RNA helicase
MDSARQITEHQIKVQLRTYQRSAVEFALDHVAKRKRSVIQLPTGTGKSLVFVHIAMRHLKQRKRVYLVVSTAEAVAQFHRLCLLLGIRAVLDIGADAAPSLAPFVITTYATAWRRFRAWVKPETLVLLDECHHVNFTAPVNLEILRSFPLAIGASATPWSRGCLEFFDGNRHVYRLSESIAAGHNAPYQIERWQAPQAQGSPIIYTDNGDDLRKICTNLKASDYAIYQRRNARLIIKRYRSDLLKAIVVRRMLTEGFDNPRCKAVYVARQTQSRIAAMQMSGRALRPHQGRKAMIFVINQELERIAKQAFRKAG